VARLAPTYVPREPHATVLYRLVKEHGDEFLRHARESYDGPLPRYVEDELRGYLRCGDFTRGFVHLRCHRCEHDLLVPFSCKNRGLCPSCAGRRMAAQAAHLVDRILPAVPIRQFVLSFPFELSLLAATKPEVLRALARIHAEELARHYKQSAKKSGEAGKLHAGAVTFVQRFGSSLNLHVHLHTCALDGVYVEGDDGEAPRFVSAAPPSRAELYVLTERVALRVMTWLRKRGYAKDDDHASNDTPERSFAEVLAQLATQRGTLENVKDDTGESDGPAEPAAPLGDEAVTRHGFNMHASLTIAAEDDLGRERLCRYGLRPPFSLSRMRVLSDGRISYRVKKSSRRRSRCRIMTPVECIARLCALVPPPRYPLTRFHGVLAPRAKLRPRIVPRLPDGVAHACISRSSRRAEQSELRVETGERPPPRDKTGPIIPAALPVSATTLARSIDAADVPMPNVLSVRHLARIGGGLLFAATSNVPWATLLARTFDIDIKACARCGGRLEVRAVVTDHDIASRILDAIPAAARAPPSADSSVAYEAAFA